jgi:hypothetical protein
MPSASALTFRNPKGLLGRIAGLPMVITNRRINRSVVEICRLQKIIVLSYGLF